MKNVKKVYFEVFVHSLNNNWPDLHFTESCIMCHVTVYMTTPGPWSQWHWKASCLWHKGTVRLSYDTFEGSVVKSEPVQVSPLLSDRGSLCPHFHPAVCVTLIHQRAMRQSSSLCLRGQGNTSAPRTIILFKFKPVFSSAFLGGEFSCFCYSSISEKIKLRTALI